MFTFTSALITCDLFQPEIKLISTQHARHFFDVDSVSCPAYTDESEWEVCNIFVFFLQFLGVFASVLLKRKLTMILKFVL